MSALKYTIEIAVNQLIKSVCLVDTFVVNWPDAAAHHQWHELRVNNFAFQQDGVPSHRLKHTVAFLMQTNVSDFIEPPNWPPNSSDLNPVDCSIWGSAAADISSEDWGCW